MTDEDADAQRRAQQAARAALIAEARAAREARITTPEGVMRRDAAGRRICDLEETR